ncbi:MAG TPA: hypothetical protein VHE99_10595 [Gammaproteobacteria bacterium]|nr:hypothetical protein [Gammaproteobacteria bacterium]
MQQKQPASPIKQTQLPTESKHISKVFQNTSPEVRLYLKAYIESFQRFELIPNKELAALCFKAQEFLFKKDYEQNMIFNLHAFAVFNHNNLNLTDPFSQQIYCILCISISEALLKFSHDPNKLARILKNSGYTSKSGIFLNVENERDVLGKILELLNSVSEKNQKNILNVYEQQWLLCIFGRLYEKLSLLQTESQEKEKSLGRSFAFFKKSLSLTPPCSLIRNGLIYKIIEDLPSQSFNDKNFLKLIDTTCDKKHLKMDCRSDEAIILQFFDPHLLPTDNLDPIKFILSCIDSPQSKEPTNKDTLVLFPPDESKRYSSDQTIFRDLSRAMLLIDLSLTSNALKHLNLVISRLPKQPNIKLRKELNEVSSKVYKKIHDIIDELSVYVNSENIDSETTAQKENFTEKLEQITKLTEVFVILSPFTDADKSKKEAYPKYFIGMKFLIHAAYNQKRELQFEQLYLIAYKKLEEALQKYKYSNFYYQIGVAAIELYKFKDALQYCGLWRETLGKERHNTFSRKNSSDIVLSVEKRIKTLIEIQRKIELISTKLAEIEKSNLPLSIESNLNFSSWRKTSKILENYDNLLKSINKEVQACQHLFLGTKKHVQKNVYKKLCTEFNQQRELFANYLENFKKIYYEFNQIPIPEKNISVVPDKTYQVKQQVIEEPSSNTKKLENEIEIHTVNKKDPVKELSAQQLKDPRKTLQEKKDLPLDFYQEEQDHDLTESPKQGMSLSDLDTEQKDTKKRASVIPLKDRSGPEIGEMTSEVFDFTSSQSTGEFFQNTETKVKKQPLSDPIYRDAKKLCSESDLKGILTADMKATLVKLYNVKKDLLNIGVKLRVGGTFPFMCCLFLFAGESYLPSDIDATTDPFDKNSLLTKVNSRIIKNNYKSDLTGSSTCINYKSATPFPSEISAKFTSYQPDPEPFLLTGPEFWMDITVEQDKLQFYMNANAIEIMHYWINRGQYPVIYPKFTDEVRHILTRLAKYEDRFDSLVEVTPVLPNNRALSKAEIFDYWNQYFIFLYKSNTSRIMHHFNSMVKMIENDVFSSKSSFKYIFYLCRGFLYSNTYHICFSYTADILVDAAKNMTRILQSYFKNQKNMAKSFFNAVNLLNFHPCFLADDRNICFLISYISINLQFNLLPYYFNYPPHIFQNIHLGETTPRVGENINGMFVSYSQASPETAATSSSSIHISSSTPNPNPT